MQWEVQAEAHAALPSFSEGRRSSIPCSCQPHLQQAVQGEDLQDYFNYQVKITH